MYSRATTSAMADREALPVGFLDFVDMAAETVRFCTDIILPDGGLTDSCRRRLSWRVVNGTSFSIEFLEFVIVGAKKLSEMEIKVSALSPGVECLVPGLNLTANTRSTPFECERHQP